MLEGYDSQCHCMQLRRAANYVTQLYDGCLKPVQLTVNQYSLLTNLGRLKTASVTKLASAVGLDRSTLVRTLQPLLDRGLIQDISASGARDRKLCLTEQGIDVLKAAKPLWRKAQAEVEKRLGPQRADDLDALLADLYRLFA